MSTSFYKRLQDAINPRIRDQRGLETIAKRVTVLSRDLGELLHHFTQLDDAARIEHSKKHQESSAR